MKEFIMDNFEWVKQLNYEEYCTPFVINNDNEYVSALESKLKSLIDNFEFCGADSDIIEIAKDTCRKIINSIDLYYKGDIVDAQTIINELINSFDDDSYAITGINNSIAFPGLGQENLEVQFFRARLSERVEGYKANEMLHIPFNKREIIKSQRFSIPGLPCLYLGNTTYDCWIELGRPADYMFNVSPALLDNTQKVLNLAVSIRYFYEYLTPKDTCDVAEMKKEMLTLLKLVILNICTSYRVINDDRNFKSEYIVSQMIMLACKKRGLDGIAYFSKRIISEMFSSIYSVNLVLFANYNHENSLSEICEHIEIDNSFNFSMYKQLLPSLKYKKYRLRVDNSPFIAGINESKKIFPYKETEFHDFDEFLFANWKRR